MKKTHFIATVVAIALLGTTLATTPTLAADATYEMPISIHLDGETHAISPYIYGINDYGSDAQIKDVTTSAIRQGGNRYTGYNWETNYSNAGEDWLNYSDTYLGTVSNGPAYAARRLSDAANTYNIDYKMITLQMAGYVAADKNGTVSEDDVAPSSRWVEVRFRNENPTSDYPDLDDDAVYMDEYVQYLVDTLGDSTTATGIQGYELDNEPALWNDTHPLLHPEEVTNSELIEKSVELAEVIKEIDPNAETYGPSFWGMLPCIVFTDADPDWKAVSGQYDWYIDYYLDQMNQASEEAGKRLLDVLDVHYYAADCDTDAGILQAARSLYDPDYTENSWLQPWYGDYFPFLNRLQESIDTYYPDTKLALTEYNLGNIGNEKYTGQSVVTAIAEVETLGAFALNDVYLATYWGTLSDCPYVVSAINLYTNYDGEGSAFGDTLVEAESDDLSKAAVFAARDGDDDSRVTATLSNKSETETQRATITFDGTDATYKSATVYAITQDNSDIRVIDVQNDIENNTVTIELPPYSVAEIVFSTDDSDADIAEEPNIITETVTYTLDELDTSVNGFPVIDLGDKEHLTKITLHTTVTSDAGSTWVSGGGALCFNSVLEDGTTTTVWGYKPYSYALGSGDNIVLFDTTYNIPDADGNAVEIAGTCLDDTAEIQDWWVCSEKDPSAGSDVTVTIDYITLTYEYDPDTVSDNNDDNTNSTTTEPTTIDATLLGDVTLDDTVSLADVVTLEQVISNIIELDSQQIINGDCDNSGNIDEIDLKMLIEFVLGVREKL